jgi:hypothetical protein
MHYHESTERKRLSGQLTARGTQTGFSVRGQVLFGLPFAAVGIFIMLIGMKAIQAKPGSVHAPFWVLTICGFLFFLAGLFLWFKALQQHRANKRRKAIDRNTGAADAMRDYPWDSHGCQPARFGKAVQTGVAAIFLTLFLSVFNWWAFGANGPLPLVIIVAVFDALLVLAWGNFLLNLSRAIRFGKSRIDFTRFPYALGESVVIRWQAEGITQPHKGSFTLRCVEEWWEVSGSGKNRSRRLVQEIAWSGIWEIETQDKITTGKNYEFKFQPPIDVPSTSLSSPRVVFWELAVKLEMAGPDFVANYLVPVYASAKNLAEAKA